MAEIEHDQTPQRSSPSVWRVLRNRIVAGLFVALPLFITFLVLDWIYRVMVKNIIGPIARKLLEIWFPQKTPEDLPFWIEYLFAPTVAFLVVLAILFVAGMFFQSRLHRTLDWILLNVPGVNLIYSAVKNVVDAIQQSNHVTDQYKRVVLVEFPHYYQSSTYTGPPPSFRPQDEAEGLQAT